MTTYRSSFSLLLVASLAASAAAQAKPGVDTALDVLPPMRAPQPELTLSALDVDLVAEITLPGSFFGGLLLATDPTLRYFFVDLPGMLDQGVLVATGKTDSGRLEFTIPGLAGLELETMGLELFGQALAIQDAILASEVVQFAPAK